MSDTELKPCPRCKGEALLHPKPTRINCTECPIVMTGVQGRSVLVEAWNTRTNTNELIEKDKIIDYLLSNVFVDSRGVSMPCGATKITYADKHNSMQAILKAIKELDK